MTRIKLNFLKNYEKTLLFFVVQSSSSLHSIISINSSIYISFSFSKSCLLLLFLAKTGIQNNEQGAKIEQS
jgi:hypothetical protein